MATLAGKEHQPPWCASAAKGTLHVLALLPQPVQPTKEEGFCRSWTQMIFTWLFPTLKQEIRDALI